jgi:serine/threonine-protein kinase
MEYVDGTDIQEYLKVNPDKINDVFIQTIQGFRHLEEFKILHRDIRPQNIMVNEGGTLKIIDFGFGKQIEFQNENFDKSISLNWRYTPPSEFNDHIYDFKTEIYFVGKLFEEIIRENGIESFGFTKVLNRMILSNYDSRITSFFDVDREVLSSKSSTIEFDQWDKRTYLEFADSLMKVYAKLYSNAEYISEVNIVIKNLEDAYNASMLETVLQNNALIAKCFVKGNYTIFIKQYFYISTIGNFIKFFKFQPVEKQKIILNNLWQRLDTIEIVKDKQEDDLPF